MEYALPDGQLIDEHFDMVVLSVGMQPPSGMARLARDLGLELREDGYCQTTNLSPLDTTREGVYVSGPLAEPRDIPETVMSASGAAARAMTLLAKARYTAVAPKEYPPERDVSGPAAAHRRVCLPLRHQHCRRGGRRRRHRVCPYAAGRGVHR